MLETCFVMPTEVFGDCSLFGVKRSLCHLFYVYIRWRRGFCVFCDFFIVCSESQILWKFRMGQVQAIL